MSFWKFIKGWIVYDFLFGHRDDDCSCGDSCSDCDSDDVCGECRWDGWPTDIDDYIGMSDDDYV